MPGAFDTGESGGLQTSPIIVGGVLYAYSPSQKVIALNAATGKLLWKFDPGARMAAGSRPGLLDRWKGKTHPRGRHEFGLCARCGYRKTDLLLLARTVASISAKIWDEIPKTQSIALTSPGVVYKDLLIVGGRDPETLPAPPGDIRAYDVRTGKLAWSFHTIPHPGEFGYDTWPKDAWKYIGAANNWTGMTIDQKRGIVYVPTGSAAVDFYGGNRLGDDLFANCLIALKAETGETNLAFPGSPARHLGPRLPFTADPGHRAARRKRS